MTTPGSAGSWAGGWNEPGAVAVFIIAGSGAGTGLFVYDPSFTLGDLIASITDATTGPLGETTEKGINAYVVAGGVTYAVGLNLPNAGAPGLSVIDVASPPFLPPGVFAVGSVAATFANASLRSGQLTSGDVNAEVVVASSAVSGVTEGRVSLFGGEVHIGATDALIVDDNQGAVNVHNAVALTPSAPGNGFSLFANSPSLPALINTAGVTGRLPVRQTDLSTNAAGNDASAHDITKTWTIPASGTVAGTIIELDAHVTVNTGQTTVETLTLGIDLNGTKTALATLGASFNGSALNTSYDIGLTRLSIVVDANGADTPQVCLAGGLGDLSAIRLATNSANMPGHANGLTFTKSSSNTIALYAQWGGAGGSAQNAQTIWSKLTY